MSVYSTLSKSSVVSTESTIEHLNSPQHPQRTFTLVALGELLDTYPLVDYKIGSAHMVILKRHIKIKGVLAK